MNVDPLAEKFPNWNPYHYVHNNPINLIDPTGMTADGWRIDEETGDKTYSEDYTKNNTPEGYTYADEILSGSEGMYYDSSGGITDVGTVLPEIEMTKKSSLHPYFNAVPSGEYGAYTPDGSGLTGTGSIGGFSISLSLVSNEKKDLEFYYSLDGGFKVSNIFIKPFGFSATIDFYDNNGNTGNIFDNIQGESKTISVGAGVYGSFSYPVLENGGRDYGGVTKTSLGISSPVVGYGGGKTYSLFGK